MLSSILRNLVILFLPLPDLVLGGNGGYFCSCDMVPGSGEWQENNGYELQSWMGSIVPYPMVDDNDYRAVGFLSEVHYVKVYDLTASNGLAWRGYDDWRLDGWLYGYIDDHMKFKPGETYYIYPDFKTALIGTFENDDKLLHGIPTEVTHYRCKDRVMELKFKKPEQNSTILMSHSSTYDKLSLTPNVRDPLESQTVYLAESDQKDSLHAKINIAPHNLVAYYNGIPWKNGSSVPSGQSSDEFYENLMRFNDTFSLNFPHHSPLAEKYISTLGHKTRRNSDKKNLVTYKCKHPVFGEIICLVASRSIQKDEELFMDTPRK